MWSGKKRMNLKKPTVVLTGVPTASQLLLQTLRSSILQPVRRTGRVLGHWAPVPQWKAALLGERSGEYSHYHLGSKKLGCEKLSLVTAFLSWLNCLPMTTGKWGSSLNNIPGYLFLSQSQIKGSRVRLSGWNHGHATFQLHEFGHVI